MFSLSPGPAQGLHLVAYRAWGSVTSEGPRRRQLRKGSGSVLARAISFRQSWKWIQISASGLDPQVRTASSERADPVFLEGSFHVTKETHARKALPRGGSAACVRGAGFP